ncbi:MAG: hypothetical protein U9R17_13770 [Thermodesulfobacteriota bacterium]|nr:hypothetical protein [Thermodesulfobacteriota bacterium]
MAANENHPALRAPGTIAAKLLSDFPLPVSRRQRENNLSLHSLRLAVNIRYIDSLRMRPYSGSYLMQ